MEHPTSFLLTTVFECPMLGSIMLASIRHWVTLKVRTLAGGALIGSTIALVLLVLFSGGRLLLRFVRSSLSLSRFSPIEQALTLCITVLIIGLSWQYLPRVARSWWFRFLDGLLILWATLTCSIWIALAWKHPATALSCFFLLFVATAATAIRDICHPTNESDEGIDIDTDLPIIDEAQDQLGRGATVDALLSILTLERPSVIALTGEFGDGKTSVLNLLHKRFSREATFKDYIVVRFSSWLPPSPENLIATLFESIISRLRSRFLIFNMSARTLEYARVITGSVPYLHGIKDLFRDSSQSGRLARLTDYINKLPVRIVLLIDDVDRMGFDELEALFKAMRGVSDMSKLSFVCAFEQATVIRLIQQGGHVEEPQRFLEKFFPIQIPLPKISDSLLKSLFLSSIHNLATTSGFSEANDKTFAKRLEQLWDRAARNYITNLRRFKLFLNKMRSVVNLIAGEVDFIDFASLEILRDMSPRTYDLVYRNAPYFYDPDWAIETWQESLHPDKKEALKLRTNFYEQHMHDESPSVTALLKLMFPKVAESSSSKGFPSIGAGDSINAEASKRICHPRFFQQYFQFRVPDDYLSQREFDNFLKEISDLTEESKVSGIFGRLYQALGPTTKRWRFLQRLDKVAESVGSVQLGGLVHGVAQIVVELNPDHFEWFNALSILETGVKRADDHGTELAMRIIDETPSDLFALSVHRHFVAEDHPERQRLLDVDKLARACGERLKKKYTDVDIPPCLFQLGSLNAVQVLLGWSRVGSPDDMRSYLHHEFEIRPHSAVEMLHLIFPDSFILDDKDIFKTFLDYRWLLDLLTQLNAAEPLTVADLKKVESLKNLPEPLAPVGTTEATTDPATKLT